MTQTAEAPEVTEAAPPDRGRSRLSLSTLLLVLAFLAPGATLLAGLVGTIPGHAEASIRRDVFTNIDSALVAAFYVGVAAFLGVMFYLFALRAKNWERGSAEDRSGLWIQRIRQLDSGLRMKTLLRDPMAGLMHSMIYYGFLVLFAGTVILEIDHLMPADWKFLTGRTYQGFSATLDLFALVSGDLSGLDRPSHTGLALFELQVRRLGQLLLLGLQQLLVLGAAFFLRDLT